LPRWLGIEPRWGVAGLTASAGLAAWVEFTLLRRTLNARIGSTGLPASLVAKLWSSAAVAAAAGWAVKLLIGHAGPVAAASAILAVYGAAYFGITYLLGVTQSAGALRRLMRLR
jgi:putative peptidoglycan lipid II flippase